MKRLKEAVKITIWNKIKRFSFKGLKRNSKFNHKQNNNNNRQLNHPLSRKKTRKNNNED
jgi:hypothetical protein